MRVTAIPTFRDNYVWAIHDDRSAILVDPGEAAPILSWLDANQINPLAVLVTHHHADHVGAIDALLARHALAVYGPARERIPGRTHPLSGEEIVDIPALGLHLQVLATPGHTLGHLCYFGHGALFCGDTLFSCGCGRLFEGTPAQMHASLARIQSLPRDTQIYCAHEYTLENLDFAIELEANNTALLQRLEEVLKLKGKPSLPVSLATELATNPFLRCEVESVVVAAAQHYDYPLRPGLETFTAVRRWRDEC